MPSVQNNTTYPVSTARRGLVYVFTPKHHGGDTTSSCWLTDLTFDEEFAIFDRADGVVVVDPKLMDERQVADGNGNLYGYETLPTGTLRELGTWHQQIAEFPNQVQGADWHGYPIWSIHSDSSQKYKGEECKPAKEVFDRMVQLGDITPAQRKRLKKGDRI